jgi:hypothetical protein
VIPVKIVRVSIFTSAEVTIAVTSAVRLKVIVMRKVSTLQKAETWPVTSKGRVGFDCKRASDLRKNCESIVIVASRQIVTSAVRSKVM